MPKTKLTVRVEKDLLQNIKLYAAKHNTTLTDLLDIWLRSIPAQTPYNETPIVRRLTGSLSSEVSLDDYRKHLEEKYAK